MSEQKTHGSNGSVEKLKFSFNSVILIVTATAAIVTSNLFARQSIQEIHNDLQQCVTLPDMVLYGERFQNSLNKRAVDFIGAVPDIKQIHEDMRKR